ncbi:MAG TPA: hypothetical protein VNM90_06180 [Haliangium sp.]|nr:hypothetical protein [Haliangium sp.]
MIKHIIAGYFGDQGEKPSVVSVQPPPSDTSRKDRPEPGGWGLVLEFLASGEHRQALQLNDYLVLHIDTDVSEQTGFAVPHREAGRELSVAELAERIRKKLEGLIGPEFCAEHGHRLIFAVAVHSVECWLLPLIYQDSHAGKITGCLNAANEARKRANKTPLSKPGPKGKGDSKDPRSYQDASRGYTKRKQLMALHDQNPSLALFVRQLARTVPGPAPDASAPPADEAPAADSTSPAK